MTNCDNMNLERLRNKAKAAIGENDELTESRLNKLKSIIAGKWSIKSAHKFLRTQLIETDR